jgi:hypothetical protein
MRSWFSVALLSMAFVAACGDKEDPIDDTVACGTEATSYATHVQPLLAQKCTRCHSSSGNTTPFFPDYSAAKTHITRIVARSEARTMPPSGEGAPLTSEQVCVLKRWVNQNQPQ